MCRTRKKAPPQFDGDERRARIRPVVVGVCRGSRPSAIVAPAAPLVSILPTTLTRTRESRQTLDVQRTHHGRQDSMNGRKPRVREAHITP